MKRPRWYSVVTALLPIVGLVLPACVFLAAYPLVKHDRVKVTDEEISLVVLCSLAFLVLELVAFVFALTARGSMLGKASVGLAAVLLVLSALTFAYVVTIRLDRGDAGWLEGTPFWIVLLGVLLVISIVLFALCRVNRQSHRGQLVEKARLKPSCP